jgi:hypothetical protein
MNRRGVIGLSDKCVALADGRGTLGQDSKRLTACKFNSSANPEEDYS